MKDFKKQQNSRDSTISKYKKELDSFKTKNSQKLLQLIDENLEAKFDELLKPMKLDIISEI